jgi:oligopeptidase B
MQRSNGDGPVPPEAERRPVVRDLHGVRVTDDYAWMRQGGDALLGNLQAERAYYDKTTAHSRTLQDQLYDEMTQRLSLADPSVSWQVGSSLYYTRAVAGKQYREFVRTELDGSGEVVLLDENELAGSTAYFSLGVRELSPDATRLAYSVDVVGDEVYELRVRDLTTGSDLPDRVTRSYYGCAWSADGTTVLYTVHDELYRPYRVMRHTLGTPVETDSLILEELDERYSLGIRACRSGELILIDATSRETSEVWLVDASAVDAPAQVVEPRRDGIEYDVEHVVGPDGGTLYIVTNDEAPEFRLMRTPRRTPGREHWTEAVAHDPAQRMLGAEAFAGHLVLTVRRDFDRALRVLDLETGTIRDEVSGLPAGTIYLSARDYDHERARDAYASTAATIVTESLIEPARWWDLDLATGERTLRHTQDVPGHDPSKYEARRVTVTAADGTDIAVSIASRRDLPVDGSAPMLLYGYGSYEASIDPDFAITVLPLLDRGVRYAIAHIRGGGEGGRTWWEQGRLQQKPNTFSDFVTAADSLAADGWADGARIASRGASAGGLLQGAVVASRPDRWRAVVAEVPFVDVVNTMLDPTAPLTINEWDEWGDPREPDAFAVMQSYSPYENVPEGDRPALLVTGSLHDARVMIYEPAKWVARLRATDPGTRRLLFRPELGAASHGGPSGRLDRLRYEAEVLAFVLTELEAAGDTPAD